MESEKFQSHLSKLYPIVEPDSSDSGSVDNVLEFMVRAGSGRSIPEAMITMVPEAFEQKCGNKYEKDGDGEKEEHELDLKEAFYKWSALRMEPWDGPALFTFSDGRFVGAILDRNGLRPSRYVQTNDGLVVMASEVGVVDFLSSDRIEHGKEEDEFLLDTEALDIPCTTASGVKADGIPVGKIHHLGRLRPGKMLLIDTSKGILIRDEEIKREIFSQRKYNVSEQIFTLDTLIPDQDKNTNPTVITPIDEEDPRSDPRLALFSYSTETIEMLLKPMTSDDTKKEALGSMGNDSALACLSNFQPLIYDYFKQVFAQVTNPPIDPFREKVVMSLATPVGPEPNLLQPLDVANRLWLDQPILSNRQILLLKERSQSLGHGWKSRVICCEFPIPAQTGDADESRAAASQGLRDALSRVCDEASAAAKAGVQVIILSDRDAASHGAAPIPALLFLGAVHHALIQTRQRSSVALFVETGEAREIHHLALLLGYGADAINPYLVFETMSKVLGKSEEKVFLNYRQAVQTGLYKVMAKMGISTLQSYKGAQIFEAVGLHPEVIDVCFKNTASRVGGSGFEILAIEVLQRHALAYKMNSDALILR
jgi:glutamate synthase (NADPH/NADH)